jgi:DNA-directed RNA polymerase subunit omega
MRRQDVPFEGGQAFRQALEKQPEFLAPLGFVLPPIMRDNGAVDLHANREVAGNCVRGDPIGVGAVGHGRPGDEHAANSPLTGRAASREFTLDGGKAGLCSYRFSSAASLMRDDYIKDALKVINDPNILINVVSRRVKQLRRGNRPLVESLEKLSPEDTALREVIEGKISHELAA